VSLADLGADIVVVGAGSAGAAYAAHSAAAGRGRGLLLEAGPDYRSADTPAEIRGANFGPVIRLGRYHWTGLTARVADGQEPKLYLQGRGAGGSSSINGQGAVRALPGDFDRWAAAGAQGWSWREILPTLCAIEDDQDFGGQPYHGSGGPIPVVRSTAADAGPVSRALAEAAAGAGHRWSPDLNAPDAAGLSPAAWNRGKAGRVTSNDAFLEPARDLASLTVRGDATVTRVLFSGTRVRGVEVVTAAGLEVVPAAEVCLAAGALHTPAILLRSGIGPAAELPPGVAPVADRPGVGRGLRDHAMIWLSFPLADGPAPAGPDTLPGHYVLRLSSGADGAGEHDLEVLPLDRSTFNPAEGGFMVSLMQPDSSGRLRLRSADPGAGPDIEFGLLRHDGDVTRLRDAVRLVAGLCRAAPLAAVMAGRLSVGGQAIDETGDQELAAMLRQHCMEYYHAAGTCRMGDPDAPGTVVSPDGWVTGVQGLRVADVSVLPDLPRAPTHLTAVAVAVHLAQRG
jgi:choline dehydrogenase-like flavoprotein